jgi:RNA polymerase sigma-70 factor (ECF subfamily)
MPPQIPLPLVEAAQRGSTADLDALVEAVWPNACRLAFAILGDGASAEDTAQEACITMYRSITSLRSAAAFRVWFYRILVRAARGVQAKNDRREPHAQEAPYRVDDAASLDVWRALATLPKNLRDVVVLRYFEDLSSREIASVLHIPDGTVRFRLMIAVRRLRPLLSDTLESRAPSNEVRINAV